MSDYFSNLVTRARATEPALKPNLASSFAPPRDVRPASRLDPVETPGPVAEQPSSLAHAGEDSPAPSEASDNETPRPETLPTPDTKLRAVESRSPVPPHETIPAATSAIGPTIPFSGEGPAQKVSTQPEAVRGKRVLTGDGPLSPPPSGTIPAVEEAPAPTMIVPSSADSGQKPAVSGGARFQRAARESNSTIHPATTLPSDGTARTNAAPPTVHVTIGRLEIRAVQSMQTVPAPPPSPRLSLDEYLRRGNGGAR